MWSLKKTTKHVLKLTSLIDGDQFRGDHQMMESKRPKSCSVAKVENSFDAFIWMDLRRFERSQQKLCYLKTTTSHIFQLISPKNHAKHKKHTHKEMGRLHA